MKSPIITVIVPAYNVGKYIEECLHSITVQTFRDFEVVVVNDASTDDTLHRIRNFIRGDGRFRIVDLPQNVGISIARNAGIKEAKGEYIFFIDADDCIYPQALELLWGALTRENADMSRSSFIRGYDFHPEEYKKVNSVVYDYVEAMRVALYQKVIMNQTWGCLMKRESLRHVGGFREGILYEDLDIFYRISEHAERIVYIREPLYFYRKNPGGLLSRWQDSRLDVLDVTDRMSSFFRERYPQLTDAAADRRFSAHFNMLLLMMKHNIDNPEASARCMRVIREGRSRALRDRNVRLKNKIGALASYGGRAFIKMLSYVK